MDALFGDQNPSAMNFGGQAPSIGGIKPDNINFGTVTGGLSKAAAFGHSGGFEGRARPSNNPQTTLTPRGEKLAGPKGQRSFPIKNIVPSARPAGVAHLLSGMAQHIGHGASGHRGGRHGY